MTMGDRIKTRQQLLDEEADAAAARDDRRNQSARPRQAHDSTVQPMQDGTNVQGGADAARQELTKLRERMAVIKQETADEVNRNWVSPWRTPAMFELKVKRGLRVTRSTAHCRTVSGTLKMAFQRRPMLPRCPARPGNELDF